MFFKYFIQSGCSLFLLSTENDVVKTEIDNIGVRPQNFSSPVFVAPSSDQKIRIEPQNEK